MKGVRVNLTRRSEHIRIRCKSGHRACTQTNTNTQTNASFPFHFLALSHSILYHSLVFRSFSAILSVSPILCHYLSFFSFCFTFCHSHRFARAYNPLKTAMPVHTRSLSRTYDPLKHSWLFTAFQPLGHTIPLNSLCLCTELQSLGHKIP